MPFRNDVLFDHQNSNLKSPNKSYWSTNTAADMTTRCAFKIEDPSRGPGRVDFRAPDEGFGLEGTLKPKIQRDPSQKKSKPYIWAAAVQTVALLTCLIYLRFRRRAAGDRHLGPSGEGQVCTVGQYRTTYLRLFV